MGFGEQLKRCREELGLSRGEVAEKLGISVSAISNYENGLSFPVDKVLLRLFDILNTEPNVLFQDSFRAGKQVLGRSEKALLEKYRTLSPAGREAVRAVLDAMCAYCEEAETGIRETEPRVIPFYRSPAAAGYAAPAFGEDFEYISVTDDVPQAAEFAVRIQGDSMAPFIPDGAVAYVNRDPLKSGDVGIFCVDGDIFCKQYHRDASGTVYLFSLNRARADADVVLPPESSRGLACFGRVIMHGLPLPV